MCCEVMRLKKSKEPDAKKSQQIDCISRLICTSKTQTDPLSGTYIGIVLVSYNRSEICYYWCAECVIYVDAVLYTDYGLITDGDDLGR